jgi:signal transduction histidine kinase
MTAMEPTRSRRELGIDALLAVIVAVVQVWGTAVLLRVSGSDETIDLVGNALLVATAAPLAVRNRFPVPVLVVVASISAVYTWFGYPGPPYIVSLVLAMWAAVSAGHRVAGLVVGLALVVNLALAGFVGVSSHAQEADAPIWLAVWLATGFGLGEVSRTRRQVLEQVQQRAVDAERTREEEARRRAGEERLRIARELHDVLAHHISVINIQAGVAVHLLDKQPDQARSALVAISAASKEAMRELRATLGVLRQVDEAEPLAPAPGLARLEDLVARASSAGIAVDVATTGEPRRLPAAADLAAYRIIQESLTNVARHSGGAHATIAIDFGAEAVEITVDDAGGGGPSNEAPPRAGNGLTGMRERAAASGGTLEAGPRPEGGYRVHAWLPLGEAT